MGPCAWITNKTVPLGLVLLNSNWSIAVEKTTPLWDHTTIWLVTVVGLITLCTTSNKPDILMVSITIHTSLDQPKKPETASPIPPTPSPLSDTVTCLDKTTSPSKTLGVPLGVITDTSCWLPTGTTNVVSPPPQLTLLHKFIENSGVVKFFMFGECSFLSSVLLFMFVL